MKGLLGRIARGEADLDFVGRGKLWLAISGSVIVLSLVGLFGTKLNLGQEFTGGTSLRVVTVREVTVPDVQDALAEFDLADVKVQLQARPDPDQPQRQQQEILLRTAHIEDRATFSAVHARLAEVAGRFDPDGTPALDEVSIDDVGPLWGRQVSTKALQGLVIFLILVTLYISVRFEWKMASGALVALFHDLIATAGIYALVGFVVTPATVIALLTLLGYSLYDTVVVFDRVRENAEGITGASRVTYAQVVNRSANQVLMRSINTSLSTMLPVGSLLFVGVFAFGADTLKDLALAMFIGTIVGTYSSLFVAIPLLAALKEREPRYRQLRARMEERSPRKEPTPVPEPPPVLEEEPVSEGGPVATVERRPRPVQRLGNRPRRRKRGKRRR